MSEKIYAERDIIGMDSNGGHYCRHIYAMTREDLHSKSDIAAELGFRDMVIAELEAKCAALAAENAAMKAAHPQPFGPEMMKALDAYEKYQDEVPETGMLDAFFILRDSIRVKTTATDAFLAEVRAQGVEMFARSLRGEAEITKACTFKPVQQFEEFAVLADECAARLRQEAAQ